MGIMRFRILSIDGDHLIVSDELTLGKGASFKIKRHQGSIIQETTEDGILKVKGKQVKT